MKLYSISEETISSIIEHNCRQQSFADGKYEVIGKDSFTQYGYLIKVVFSQKKGKVPVITAYPLKRGLKK
jgi:hypothetical protein